MKKTVSDVEMERLRRQYIKSGCAIGFILAVVLYDGFQQISYITDGFTDLDLDRKAKNDFMVYYSTMATLPFVIVTLLFGFMYSVHEKIHGLSQAYHKN